MNIKKGIFSLLVLLSLPAYAFRFSPLGFDKSLTEGGMQEFKISNTGKEIVRYKIEAKDTGKPTDISHLVAIYPKVITVEPLSEASFKVYVEESDYPAGEYSFILGIKPIKMPKIREVGKGKTKSTLAMKTALDVEVFAYAGEIKDKFDIENSQFYTKNGEKYWKANIKNNTGRGYELATGFTDKNDMIIDLHNEGRLFNGNEASINVKIPKGSKYIIFWDHNNIKPVCQKIKVQ